VDQVRSRGIPYITEIYRKLEGMITGTDPVFVHADVDDPLSVSPTFGVPNSFTQQTSSSKTFLLQKGQLNHLRQRPTIINEHVETARQIQSTVTETNIVGQIFKASQDNINSIALTLRSAGGEVFDDFEEYADTTALRVEWVASSARLASLETTIITEGLQSMALPTDGDVGDEWTRSFDATDFTGFTGTFKMYSTKEYKDVQLSVMVKDSQGGSSAAPIVNQEKEVWEDFEFMVENLAGTADLTDIVEIGFLLDKDRGGGINYIDYMVSFPPAGSVDIELWDLGTTLPVSGVDALDDGAIYPELGDKGINSGAVSDHVTFDLLGGRRQYTVQKFIAGVALEIPGNTLLDVGNYYAIVLRYVNAEIDVFGADTSYGKSYYNNGYAFTTPDNATPITTLGEFADIQFAVMSTQDVWINTLLKFYDADPGPSTTETVYVEDKDMKIENVIAGENTPQRSIQVDFRARFFCHSKGGKFEVNVNSAFDDDTTQATVLYGYLYEPPTING